MVRWRAGSEAMRWATEPRDLTGATSDKDQGEGCAEVANSAHSLADNASHATSNTIAAYRRDEFLNPPPAPTSECATCWAGIRPSGSIIGMQAEQVHKSGQSYSFDGGASEARRASSTLERFEMLNDHPRAQTRRY